MFDQTVRDPLLVLHPNPVGTDSDRAGLSLLSRLERWEEDVNFINFLHSRCKMWSTINKLTGSSLCLSHLCPVMANSFASQLVKNGAHRTGWACLPGLSSLYSTPEVCTPRWVSSQILVLWFPHFLYVSTQNSKDLDKSTCSCDPLTRKATGRPKQLPPYISAVCPL